jgi:hypothetical protein
MRERRPAPEQQVEPRSERAGGSLEARDPLQLASQLGNVAFTALARTLARQPDEDTIVFPPDHVYPEGAGQGPTIGPDGTLEFPPEHIGPSGEEPTIGPDGTLEFPPDYVGPTEGPTVGPDGTLEFPPDYVGPSEEPTVGPDGTLEFPPDYIGPDSSGAGAAAGAAGESGG